MRLHTSRASFLSCSLLILGLMLSSATADRLLKAFKTPPDYAKPWVYWYFMDGNLTREGMTADLEAMKKAQIGGVIFLEVDIGIPRGPVGFMSPEWRRLFSHAVAEADRLGIQVALGSGPGWCGTGGPWVSPEDSMQHIVASSTNLQGPVTFRGILERPKPRTPFFGEGTLTPSLKQAWLDYYVDQAVIAFPTPSGEPRVPDLDEKALYFRAPISSQPGVKPFLPAPATFAQLPEAECVQPSAVINLNSNLSPNGELHWEAPPGNWTILRLGRTLTGQTTRPAPLPGLGFETDKFNPAALQSHLDSFVGEILNSIPGRRRAGRGLTTLHFDSWEMSSQNASLNFFTEFNARRGYDIVPFLPVLTGRIVGSLELSERFLWDLRITAQELVLQNHIKPLRDYAHKHGLRFSSEPYDMNPCSDIEMGSFADVPMCEFWSLGHGFRTEYSCFEAVSIAHTTGKSIVAAEAFTAAPGEDWQQHPASMKDQGDWAFCAGINRLAFHRYQHQPTLYERPGMTMGPYGVFWERTQTWWNMVPAYHDYLARCQHLLQQGTAVADILYLTPEGAPHVFQPPASATHGNLPDRRGYNFDACSPGILLRSATVSNGQICFPGGTSYRVLVLPNFQTMTPALLVKIRDLLQAGAMVIGNPPVKSPSLQGYPDCDAAVARLARDIWGDSPTQARRVGQGIVIRPPDIADQSNIIRSARWIWHTDPKAHAAAPVSTRLFSRSFTIPEGKHFKAARIQITADNTFDVRVNGVQVAQGTDFRLIQDVNATPQLKFGTNLIEVEVRNLGDNPNPAGLIAALQVLFSDGSQLLLITDKSWTGHDRDQLKSCEELGGFDMSPWQLTPPTPEIYPAYDVAARALSDIGIPPDFETDGNLRYTHRKLSDRDLYFVANRSAKTELITAQFRVSGKSPEWWDPISGTIRRLKHYKLDHATTAVTLQLEQGESGFVVFHQNAGKVRATAAVSPSPAFAPFHTVEGPWQVEFDPAWGGPERITFPELVDWTKHPEDNIRHYSGEATYRTAFNIANLKEQGRQTDLVIDLGSVKNLASVQLNGKSLGSVWCHPWRLSIPRKLIRAENNQLEITVANLWINRLIGDSGLPKEQQLSKTTRNPYRPEHPLKPSGLLGPVTLQSRRALD